MSVHMHIVCVPTKVMLSLHNKLHLYGMYGTTVYISVLISGRNHCSEDGPMSYTSFDSLNINILEGHRTR